MSIRDEILALSNTPPPREPLKVPGWPESTYCMTMTSVERDTWDSQWYKWRTEHNGDARDSSYADAFLLVYVLCDADGKRIFAECDAEDLAKQDCRRIAAAARVAERMNALRVSDLDEYIKNSGSAPTT